MYNHMDACIQKCIGRKFPIRITKSLSSPKLQTIPTSVDSACNKNVSLCTVVDRTVRLFGPLNYWLKS